MPVSEALVERAARATFDHGQRRGSWKGYTWDSPDLVSVRKTHLDMARLVLEMAEQPQADMWYGVRQIGASLVAVTVAESRHSLAMLIARDAGAEYVASWSGEAWVDLEQVR